MLRTYISICLLLGIFWACVPAKKWKEAHTPADDACVHCHYGIYKDWKIAYKPYNEADKTGGYEPVHSRPMSKEDVAKRRSHKTGQGECGDCHTVFMPDEMLIISELGKSFEDTMYQLCGRCHDRTFREWKGSRFFAQNTSCLICHTDKRDNPLGDKGGYFHNISGLEGFDADRIRPALMLERLKEAVSITEDIWVADNKANILLIIANKGVGHNLPTDALNASILLKMQIHDSRGNKVDEKELVVSGGGKASIAPGKDVYIESEMILPSKGKYSLEITVYHADRERKSYDQFVSIFNKKVELNSK